MNRRLNRVQQSYGYIVCLIAIVAGLIAGKGTLDAAFDLARPSPVGQYGPSPGMQSFESYKAERQMRNGPPNAQSAPIPPDSVLHRLYVEERDSQARFARWQATKSLVTDGVVLVVAILLFATHWRWLRESGGEPHVAQA